MTPSDALKKDEENRSRPSILLAQIALFTATIFVRNTRLYAEHDRTGFKTALSYQIIVTLVSNSRSLSDLPCLEFIHKKCGWMVNAILNTICLILAIVFEEIYEEIFEKSLSSLGFVLSITVLLLILLVIIRPFTDLGLFGFLIGVIGLVTHNLFRLKFQTWIFVASCFPLFVFRFWLEAEWMESRPQPPAKRCKKGGYYYIPWIIEVLTVAGFRLFWVYNLFSTNCQALEGQPKSISCTSSSAMGTACELIFNLYFGHLLIRLVYEYESSQTDPGRARGTSTTDPERVATMELRLPPPTMRRREKKKPLRMSSAHEGIEARPPLGTSSAQEAIAPKKED